MEILKAIGLKWRERRLKTALYMGQMTVVRTLFGETEPIAVGCGSRQGCLLSLILFNNYDKAMMREKYSKIYKRELW